MSESTHNVVARSLRTTLELFTGNSAGPNEDDSARPIRVVSYSDSFGELWASNALRAQTSDRLVVVWDETPGDGGNSVDDRTRSYVTAFDWAAAAAMTLRAKTSPSVVLVDLASGSQRDAFSVQALPRLQASKSPAMPWLSIVRESEICGLVCQLLQTSAASDSDTTLLRPLWREHLTSSSDSENRHAISNVVGPILLRAGMGTLDPTTARPSIQALLVQLRALGLLPTVTAHPAPWFPPSQWEHLVEKIILIDDMAEVGWRTFLAESLGISSKQIRTCTEPDRDSTFGPDGTQSICDLIEESFAVSNGHGIRLGGDKSEIVFLDLRLFSWATDPGREIAFLRRLVSIATAHGAKHTEAPIDQLEVTEIANWLDRGADRADQRYLDALSLFPRLIAIADPTLPIVLFSSTTQRRVIERLRPYANIVTGFAKPTFFQEQPVVAVGAAYTQLETAFARGLQVARARTLCRGVVSAAGRMQATTHNFRHVEIYLEESGDITPQETGRLAVGGLVIRYPDESVANTFWLDLQKDGLAWGHHVDAPWDSAPVQCLPKASASNDKDIRGALERVDALAQSRGMAVSTFLVRGTAAEALTSSFLSWNTPDSVYRFILRQALELLLFEWLAGRQSSKSEPATCSIYGATRVLVRDADLLIQLQRAYGITLAEAKNPNAPTADIVSRPDAIRLWNQIGADLGFLRTGDPVLSPRSNRAGLPASTRSPIPIWAYSIAGEHIHPIVADIFSARKQTLAVKAARAVTLDYYGRNAQTRLAPHQLPRQVHYAADYIVSRPDLAPSSWSADGFDETSGHGLDRLIEASRYCDDPARVVEALSIWLEAGGLRQDSRSVRRWMTKRLGNRVKQMTASEFDRLSRLRQPPRIGRN